MFSDKVKDIFERVGAVRTSNLIPLCMDLMRAVEKSKYVVGEEKKELVLRAIRENVKGDETLLNMVDSVLPYVIDLVIFLAKHKRLLKDFATCKHCVG